MFAQVKPSPAAPLLYQLFGAKAPERSAVSVSHTFLVVFIGVLGIEEYECDVMTSTISSTPAEISPAVRVVWAFQPVASQQVS